MKQPDRYCSNCGQRLLQEDRFCVGCGRPAHETAHVPTPEADVPAPPPRQGFWAEETPPGRSRGFGGGVAFWVAVLTIPVLLVLFFGMLLVFAALGYSGGEAGAITGRILVRVFPFVFFGLLGLVVLWIAVSVVLNVIRHARDMMR